MGLYPLKMSMGSNCMLTINITKWRKTVATNVAFLDESKVLDNINHCFFSKT